MLFYIAARFGKRDDLGQVCIDLVRGGHGVCSRWIMAEQNDTPLSKMTWAKYDLDDVRIADAMIFFAESQKVGYTTGGRHVEFGVAVERGIPIHVIGGKENIFHWLPKVYHYSTWNDFLKGLANA